MAGFCFSKRPQTPHSPETALLPRRSQPSQTPGHPRCIRCCVATGASHLLPKIKWAYPRRFCGAETPPPHHSAGERQPGLSQNSPWRQEAPGGYPTRGPPPGGAHLGPNTQ
jgi:hypothetical protein